jgi:hypothetical protein
VRSTRVVAIAAVVVLVALVAGAIALASGATVTPTVTPSHLEVGAGPPTTATGLLTYSDSNGITVDGTCAFDFADGTADLDASVTLSVITVRVGARLVDRVIYFSVPEFASLIGAQWASTSALHGPARLEDLAVALRHPDLDRLHPRTRVVTTGAGGTTTTTMGFGEVHVGFANALPFPLPSQGVLTVAITTGPSGQLYDVDLRLVAVGDTVRLGYEATGYDVPVAITAPPPDQVRRLTPARAKAIFGTDTATLQHLLAGLHHLAG